MLPRLLRMREFFYAYRQTSIGGEYMPNEKVLEEKKALVADLSQELSSAASGVLVDYKGITVDADTKLRRDLRASGVRYSVVKNSLLRFASRDAGLESMQEHLTGTTALATSDDLVAPAKVLSAYAKKNPKFVIKAGFVEGRMISSDEVQALAELPPKEILIARVLGGFNAPISGFANVLNANLRGLVVALNAIAEKKGA